MTKREAYYLIVDFQKAVDNLEDECKEWQIKDYEETASDLMIALTGEKPSKTMLETMLNSNEFSGD